MARAVVVGYGSIGQRHVRLLKELGCDVSVVSRRSIDYAPCFKSLREAITANLVDYVVVANETSAHSSTIGELVACGFKGSVLVEKPLGGYDNFENFKQAAVGYNLRFHPVLIELAKELNGEKIIAINAYCGQYLPNWRPHSDYRVSYSADAKQGGGVLRDLSHELDYLLWLAGPWRRVAAVGGKFSELEIKSDDCWALLLQFERCPAVTLQVNYLDRPGRREIIVNTAEHTFIADLNAGKLTRDGVTKEFPLMRDTTYLAQHQAMLNGDKVKLCTIAQGEDVMKLVEAVEHASIAGKWVDA